MAKSLIKLEARRLRRKGVSIREIAGRLNIAKSTASLWCNDIKLSPSQISTLHKSMVRGGYKGRMKGARTQKDKRLKIIADFQKNGIKAMKTLTNRDLLLVGLGLHLGEGNKQGNQFQFTNSNPNIIKIIILWLKQGFKVPKRDLYCNIIINIAYKNRINRIQKQWSKIIGISLRQFKAPVFIKAKNKKVYENANEHLGTLTLRVKKSSNLHYQILGLCHGLIYNLS